VRNNAIGESFKITVYLVLIFAAAVGFSPTSSSEQKMKSEDVVAKHLESVGTPAARAAIKSRIAVGTVVVSIRTPSMGQASGRIVMASEGEKHLVGMMFDKVPDYPQEKLGYDAKNVTLSYVRPGVRSSLGNFFQIHKSIIKQGLVGGALSQAWPLFDLATSKPKLESSGTKKVGEREAYVLKYLPRGASDLEVTLFFDAETFQHLRSEYKGTFAAQMGATVDQSARQRESRYRLVEDFSDFRKEGGLMLPHKYKIFLEMTLPAGSYKADWEATLSEFGFNQDIDPKSFDVEAN
jgi:hypothetical protein